MNRSKASIALMAASVLAASLLLFFLLTTAENRDGRAWISLGMVVLAESLLSLQLLRGERTTERSTPMNLVRVTILTLYLAGVLAAAVLGSGLFRMPLRGYLVVHVLLGVVLIVSYGSVSIFDRRGVEIDAGTRTGRLRLRELALEVQVMLDRVEGRPAISSASAGPSSGGSDVHVLLESLRTLKEKLRYSDPAGIPGIEAEDAEIGTGISELKSAIDKALGTGNPETRIANSVALARDLVKRIDRRNDHLSGLK